MQKLQIKNHWEHAVQIRIHDAVLQGTLIVPENALGLVIFAHGSGSSRLSPRNRFVAEHLQKEGFGTLLFDLLTQKEEQEELQTGKYRFDITLLTERLLQTTDWFSKNQDFNHLNLGYFGASTGAAAALMAAAKRPRIIKAIVSRGGRPDLADPGLSQVKAPTLLIVGGNDTTVLELNRQALQNLSTEKDLSIISGATHLFEEPGALEEVSNLATDWFARYLNGVNKAI